MAKALCKTNQNHYASMRVPLPLPADNLWAALVTLAGRLRAVVGRMRTVAGDDAEPKWHPQWTDPAIQFLVSCVTPGTHAPRLVTDLLKLHTDVDRGPYKRKPCLERPRSLSSSATSRKSSQISA